MKMHLAVRQIINLFFKWFRLQDDILNEKSTSRSKWMQQNRTWIRKRIHQLFDLIEESSKK